MSLDISYSGGVFSAPQAKSVGTVTAGTGTYNLSVASYDGVSFSVGTQETSPTGIHFKPDGTKMFITGFTDRVFEYTMSTAWDLSTLSFVDYFSASQSANASDVFFSTDGTKFYVEDQTSSTIYQYSMTEAWDVSTASYDSKSFSVSSQETGPLGIHFKPDGTKMYVVGYFDDKVVQYSLSTAWDVSTASYDSKESPSVVSVTGNPTDVIFNPDGTKMWVTGVSDVVAEYGLSTAWDVSTATYSSISFDVSGQTDSPRGITFKPDGSKMYLVELTNDTVYQYSTGTATTLDLSTGNYFSHTPTANTTFAFSNAPASGTAAGFALALTGANVGEGYDIANASYDSVSFSVATQDNNPQAIFFKSDGTAAYVAGNFNDTIYQYSLSTAWDLSTISYASKSFSVASQSTVPNGLFFKPDGTKMFVSSSYSPTSSNDAVYEYNLSTAWDVSTASYSSVSFSVATQEDATWDLTFKSDGTKFYIVGFNAGGRVHEYNLSTAWDLSTASHNQTLNIHAQETTPAGIFFHPDGDKMFILGSDGDDVTEYSLSTAWDISTASSVRTFSVSSQDTTPTGLFFKSDGAKMYVLGNGNDTIFQYSTGSTATATFTYPSSVKFPSGTAPAGPAIGETDVLVFYTDDGGTTYQGFRAGNAMS